MQTGLQAIALRKHKRSWRPHQLQMRSNRLLKNDSQSIKVSDVRVIEPLANPKKSLVTCFERPSAAPGGNYS